MKKLIQILLACGFIVVMGGTAQGLGTMQQDEFKKNNKHIMLYAHITDFEHNHGNGDLHKADKNYIFKKGAEKLKQEKRDQGTMNIQELYCISKGLTRECKKPEGWDVNMRNHVDRLLSPVEKAR
jgi:hypothetical protein